MAKHGVTVYGSVYIFMYISYHIFYDLENSICPFSSRLAYIMI
jgi:hypothetical protein